MQEGQSSGQPPVWPRKINDSVWEFWAPSDPPSVEIIFFHGIQLGNKVIPQPCLNTWTKKGSETEYWPQTFFKEDGRRVRALTAAYDASNLKTDEAGRVDIFLVAENFISTIVENRKVNVGQKKNVPVILVAHSFGGLLVKDFLGKAQNKARGGSKRVKAFLDNLAGVFFYSTPHLALKKEVFGNLFPGKDETGQNVEYSELVSLLEQLNNKAARLAELMKKIVTVVGQNWGGVEVMEVLETRKTKLGSWTGMILEEGSGRSTSAHTASIDEDHFGVCRPENSESASYALLSDFIATIEEKVKAKEEAEKMELDQLDNLPSAPTTTPHVKK